MTPPPHSPPTQKKKKKKKSLISGHPTDGQSPFCTLCRLYRGGLPGRQVHFLFCIYNNVICTAECGIKTNVVLKHRPMLTLPSWSSNVSHMILSGKMLKRVCEGSHPCRTPADNSVHTISDANKIRIRHVRKFRLFLVTRVSKALIWPSP